MNQTVRKITMLGMLLAAQVVAGLYVSIKLPIVNIGFIFLPLAIVAILYGPVWCALSAVLGDVIIAMMGPYGYFPPLALSALAGGIIYGLFLYGKPANLYRITACVLAKNILVSILLQTFLLTFLTGKGYMALLPARLVQNAIMTPVQIVCIRWVAYRITDMFPKEVAGPVSGRSISGR